jgi:hypothetical protein
MMSVELVEQTSMEFNDIVQDATKNSMELGAISVVKINEEV